MAKIRTYNKRARRVEARKVELLSNTLRRRRERKAARKIFRVFMKRSRDYAGLIIEIAKGAGKTFTGRVPSQPEMQHIGSRYFRQAERPAPDIVTDFSAIEARAMASMDIHSETAKELYGEVTPETRAKAKTINYAKLYGMSGVKMFQKIQGPPKFHERKKHR